MTDREMLELAAKAAGINIVCFDAEHNAMKTKGCSPSRWNPLTDDGDALRLANKLSIDILHNWESVTAQWELGKFCREKCTDETRSQATRKAITRAAAEIGKEMT